MDFLTDFVIEFTEILNLKPDCFFGVPEGATKLGVLTQFKWAKNQEDYKKYGYRLAMGRGKPKEHGAEKDRHYLGVPKGKVIVLEDVTTTGGSLIQTLNNLIELDVDIIAAISLTNRNEIRDDGSTVEDLIDKLSVKYYSMSQALELLPQLFIRNNIDEYITKKIQAYFKKYGQKELILK
jgi:orotate phosphoribosyltransferase